MSLPSWNLLTLRIQTIIRVFPISLESPIVFEEMFWIQIQVESIPQSCRGWSCMFLSLSVCHILSASTLLLMTVPTESVNLHAWFNIQPIHSPADPTYVCILLYTDIGISDWESLSIFEYPSLSCQWFERIPVRKLWLSYFVLAFTTQDGIRLRLREGWSYASMWRSSSWQVVGIEEADDGTEWKSDIALPSQSATIIRIQGVWLISTAILWLVVKPYQLNSIIVNSAWGYDVRCCNPVRSFPRWFMMISDISGYFPFLFPKHHNNFPLMCYLHSIERCWRYWSVSSSGDASFSIARLLTIL